MTTPVNLPPETTIHITWDDEQGNPGWYVQIVESGPTMADQTRTVTDSMKRDFPVDVDRFGRGEARELVNALRPHFPQHARISGMEHEWGAQ